MNACINSVTSLFREWDRMSNDKKIALLNEFVAKYQGRTEPELESEFGHLEALFLIRICVFIKLNFVNPANLTAPLKALHLFVSSTSGTNLIEEVVENGLIITLQEICSCPKSSPENKYWALRVLRAIADTCSTYREMICECLGIRVIAECLTQSQNDKVLDQARRLLEALAETSDQHREQVYCSFIGILPCPQSKAQQHALQALLTLQAKRAEVHPTLIELALKTLESRYLEVQCAAAQLFCLLIKFEEVSDQILTDLIKLLRPKSEIRLHKKQKKLTSKEEEESSTFISGSTLTRTIKATPPASRGASKSRFVIPPGEPITCNPNGGPFGVTLKSLVVKEDPELAKKKFIIARTIEQENEIQTPPEFNQQANACLCIITLCQERSEFATKLLKLKLLTNLLYALGNMENEESQRIAAQALRYFCERFTKVAKLVEETLGNGLYEQLMTNTERFYFRMTPFEADVMLSNKIDYAGEDLEEPQLALIEP